MPFEIQSLRFIIVATLEGLERLQETFFVGQIRRLLLFGAGLPRISMHSARLGRKAVLPGQVESVFRAELMYCR